MLELQGEKRKKGEKVNCSSSFQSSGSQMKQFCSLGHLTLFPTVTTRKEVPLASIEQRPRMRRALLQCAAQDGAHAREISNEYTAERPRVRVVVLSFHPIPFPSMVQEDLETQTITLENNPLMQSISD